MDSLAILSRSFQIKPTHYGTTTTTEMKMPVTGTFIAQSQYETYHHDDAITPVRNGRRHYHDSDDSDDNHRGNGVHGRRGNSIHVEIEGGNGSVTFPQSAPTLRRHGDENGMKRQRRQSDGVYNTHQSHLRHLTVADVRRNKTRSSLPPSSSSLTPQNRKEITRDRPSVDIEREERSV